MKSNGRTMMGGGVKMIRMVVFFIHSPVNDEKPRCLWMIDDDKTMKNCQHRRQRCQNGCQYLESSSFNQAKKCEDCVPEVCQTCVRQWPMCE